MGRRSFISVSQINRLMSSISAAQKRARQNEMIGSQSGIQKEMSPTYDIIRFEFNETSRVAHIEFLETKKYRKIERYVTQNYVRYPIYSDWNTKTKIVKKTIKLSNQELESLIYNSDPLICDFAYEIIDELNDDSLIPSWYMKRVILEQKKERIASNNSEFNNFKQNENNKQKEFSQDIAKKNAEKRLLLLDLEKKTKRLEKYNLKLQKSISKKPNIFLTIISFGIYAYLRSNRRIHKLSVKKETLNESINLLNTKIKAIDNAIDNDNKEIEMIDDSI